MGKFKSGPNNILDISWDGSDTFICVGPKTYQYWNASSKVDFKKPPNSMNSKFKDNILLCARHDSYVDKFLVGSAKGYLMVCKGKSVVSS